MAVINGTNNADTINQNFNPPVTNNADFIKGLGGDDFIYGLGGDDVIQGGAGADTLTGGDGTDRADYAQSAIGVSVKADYGDVSGLYGGSAGAEGDTFADIFERLGGSNHADILMAAGSFGTELYGLDGADRLKGYDGADYLDGGAGADEMAGGRGNDTYIVDNSGDYVHEDADQAGASPGSGFDIVFASVSFLLTVDSYTSEGSGITNHEGAENLILTGSGDINGTGNLLNNTIIGNSGANHLGGGAGSDILRGGAGNDVYVFDGVDSLDESVAGSGGIDTVESSATVGLAGNALLLGQFENITLTGTAAINATGDGLAKSLVGNDGVNILTGAGGNDVLQGGSNYDTLRGGAGNDTYYFDDQDTVDESAAGSNGIDTVLVGGAIKLNGNTRILGSVENIRLTGSASVDATGNALDNQINGNIAANVLRGLGGNDVFGGEGGGDTLIGGTGNDTYFLNSNDTIVEVAAEGNDRAIYFYGSNSFVLGAGVSVEIIELSDASTGARNLTGNDLAQAIVGNAAVNTLQGQGGNDTLNGGLGNDTLIGGAGADILNGGANNDTYHLVADTSDTITDASGVDTVTSIITRSLAAYTTIENLSLVGVANINGTGNGLTNSILGNTGNNVLNGGAGADTLNGGAGNDGYLLGGEATGLDTIIDASGMDTIYSTISRSIATFAMIENLTLQGAANINGSGNGLNNALTGNSGVNTLTGGAGNDVLNGGTGADTLHGGADNDTYYLGADSDVVIDASGTDNITSTITRSLVGYASIENLYLQGATAINGTGNGLANLLAGNGANNVLKGGTNTDTLRGGLGTDSLYGEAGNDKFQFLTVGDSAPGATRDIIYDLDDAGDDTIDLSLMAGVTTFIGTNAFANAGEVRIQQAGVNVLVQINTVGTGTAESEILIANATIGVGAGQVDAGDFLL